MEFEPSSVVWKSRGKDAVLGTSIVNGKEGSKLVLITTQSEIMEHCTQTRKCVNHWTFRPGSSSALRHAAVRHPVSLTYFGVRAAKKQGETLVSWKQSDLDVSKWKHTPLKEKSGVVGLYVHPQLPEDVVVVFESGRFACYDDVLSQVFDSSAVTPSDDSREVEGKVVWASLATNHRNPMKGSLFLSLLVQSTTDAAQYEVVIYRIVPNKERRDARVGATLLARHALQNNDTKSATVESCAFHAETLSYSIIWSTGEWQMLSFTQEALSGAVSFASTKKITTLSPDLTTSDSITPAQKKRKLSNAGAASATHFVASNVGAFSYVVVGSSAAPQKLQGWDSKFGVQVATTELQSGDDSDRSSIALPTNVGQLRGLISSLFGEVVVVAYEYAVYLLTVKNKHSTLASVLGVYAAKPTMNHDGPALPDSIVDWKSVAEDKSALSHWEQAVCSEDAEEQQLIADLIATKGSSFQKKFDAAVAKLTKDGKELSYRFLMAITRRCVETPEAAMWSALKVLLPSKRLSARAIPTLLPVLMKHNQFELLELALVHLTDIDERSIVRLLRYVIRKNGDQDMSKTVKVGAKGKRKKTDEDRLTADVAPCERFVVALLGLPTNTVFLHHAIRELALTEVLFLLAICKKYFYALVQGEEIKPSATFFTAMPSSTQFCAWICTLIDGHVTQLVLSASKDRGVAMALEQLNTLVQQQLESCERYEGVHNVLSNFLSGVKLPRAHGIPEYSIEELVM